MLNVRVRRGVWAVLATVGLLGSSLTAVQAAAEVEPLDGSMVGGVLPESARGEGVSSEVEVTGRNETVPPSFKTHFPDLTYPESAANPATSGGTQVLGMVEGEPGNAWGQPFTVNVEDVAAMAEGAPTSSASTQAEDESAENSGDVAATSSESASPSSASPAATTGAGEGAEPAASATGSDSSAAEPTSQALTTAETLATEGEVEVAAAQGIKVVALKATEAITVTDKNASGGDEIGVGKRGGRKQAAYVRFGDAAQQLAGRRVLGAQLSVADFEAPSCTPQQMTVHKVTSGWGAKDSKLRFPGPGFDHSPLGSVVAAHGFVAHGQNQSSCPLGAPTTIDLGGSGAELVQGWSKGGDNHGLSLRAGVGNEAAWKKIAGAGTANPPTLYVTVSDLGASYESAGAFDPPVLQNASGKLPIKIRNESTVAWTPDNFYLAYAAYRHEGGDAPVAQDRSADLTEEVPPGGEVTLMAEVKAMPLGVYVLEFTMMRKGGESFVQHGVPPFRLMVEVSNIVPVLKSVNPPNGFSSPSLTPQLWARATDLDAPTEDLQYSFTICRRDEAEALVDCVESGWLDYYVWDVPADKLSWNEQYVWTSTVKDNAGEVASPEATLFTKVAQQGLRPAGTARSGKPFEPLTGVYSTAAVDAQLPGPGGGLSVNRAYTSADGRKHSAFGPGWASLLDMKVEQEPTGAVVVTLIDGAQVRFSEGPGGAYSSPSDERLRLNRVGEEWHLSDNAGFTYAFNGHGALLAVTPPQSQPIVAELESTAQWDGIKKLTDKTTGRSMQVEWKLVDDKRSGRVNSIEVHGAGGEKQRWEYRYDDLNRLTAVCDPTGGCTRYEWTDQSIYAQTVLATGPEAYWRMGETGGDTMLSVAQTSVNGHDGQYDGAGLGANGAMPGSSNKAIRFPDSGAARLPDGLLNSTPELAVEMWAQVKYDQGDKMTLLTYGKDAEGGGQPLLYVGDDRFLRGKFAGSAGDYVRSKNEMPNDTWWHVVMQVRGDKQQLFVNGELQGETQGTADHQELKTAVLGAAKTAVDVSGMPAGDHVLNGSLDEVAVYRRTLTPEEIAQHYQLGKEASSLVSKVTMPSGHVLAAVQYDSSTGRVSQATDSNGGTWHLTAPTTSGSVEDLRSTVMVTGPGARHWFYEYDARTRSILREGAPSGVGLRPEDRPQPDRKEAPDKDTCRLKDLKDSEFCIIIIGKGPGERGDWVTMPITGTAVKSFTYDSRGNMTDVTDENGNTVRMTHDDRGNAVTKTTCADDLKPETCSTSYSSYANGFNDPLDPRWDKVKHQADGRSSGPDDQRYETNTTYNEYGQVTAVSDPGVGVTVQEYSKSGAAAIGGGTLPGGLPVKSTSPSGAVTTMGYNSRGDLVKVSESSGTVTEFVVDGLGRRTSQKVVSDAHPEPVVTTYEYDAAGRVVAETAPKTKNAVTGAEHQVKTSILYDVDGRVMHTKLEDIVGSDPDRVTRQGYDAHGRVSWVEDATGARTSYTFDDSGNRTAEEDAQGNRTEYAYTSRDDLAEVRVIGMGEKSKEQPYKVVNARAYDLGGRLVSNTDALGRTVRNKYYDDDRVREVIQAGFKDPVTGKERDVQVNAYRYDGAGNVIEDTGLDGKERSLFKYDEKGRQREIAIAPQGRGGSRETFTYDAVGNVLSVVLGGESSGVPGGSLWVETTTKNSYDVSGRLLATVLSGEGTPEKKTTYTYDQLGNTRSVTSPLGQGEGANAADHTTRFEYDVLGQRVKTIYPPKEVVAEGKKPGVVSVEETVGYNAYGDVVAVRNAVGEVSRFEVDAVGRTVKVAGASYTPATGGDAVTPTTSTEYDRLGQPVKMTDPLGGVTVLQYDRLGRVVRKEEPSSGKDPAVTQFRYDLAGQLTETIAPNGQKQSFRYDVFGHQIAASVTERVPAETELVSRFEYDAQGRMTKEIGPTGGETTYQYDGMGRVLSSTDPHGVTQSFGYNGSGAVVWEADHEGNGSRTWTTPTGEVTKQEELDPAGKVLRSVQFAYDVEGRMVSTSSSGGKHTSFVWSTHDELVSQTEKVSDEKSITTKFGYDGLGRRTQMVDGRGNPVWYSYNSLGLLEKTVEPSTAAHPEGKDRSWVHVYDAAGQEVKTVNPGGAVVDRTFNPAGLLVKEHAHGGGLKDAVREFGYDTSGRVTSAGAPGGKNVFSYNDRGMITSATGPGGESAFTYTEDGGVKQRRDAAGTATFTWDKGRLVGLKDPLTQSELSYGYNSRGDVSLVNYPGGRQRRFGYDSMGRLVTDELFHGEKQVAAMAYGFDEDHNVISRSSTGYGPATNETLTYDGASRLVSWAKDGVTVGYEWDDSGNRVQAGSEKSEYDARNRLTKAGNTTLEWTAGGQVSAKVAGDVRTAYEFDGFGQMVRAGASSMEYDSLGRMTKLGDRVASFAGAGADPVGLGEDRYGLDPAGAVVSARTGGANRLVVANAHGDVVGGFDPGAQAPEVTDHRQYDPFGVVTDHGGTDPLVGFQGDVTDPETGAVNMGARWYDPATGGFLSRDTMLYTAGASILANRYTYGAGNPVTYSDPDGHWPSWGSVSRGARKLGSAVSSPVRRAASATWNGARRAGSYVYNKASSFVRSAYSFVKRQVNRVVNAVKSTARWVYRTAKAAAKRVVRAVRSGVTRVVRTVKQTAAQARAAVEHAKREVTRRAKQVAAYVAKHNPLPAVKRMLEPVMAAAQQVVTDLKNLPAAVVETSKRLANSAAERTQQMWQDAVEAAGPVLENVRDGVNATTGWIGDNKGMLIGAVVGGAVGAACLAVTAGAGSIGCMVAAGAVAGAVTDTMDCPAGQDKVACGLRGAVVGGVMGLIPGGGTVGGSVARSFAGDAAGGALTSVIDDVGHGRSVTGSGVLMGAATGMATGGRGGSSAPSGPRRGGSGCANSFTEDTHVVMEDGSTKPIGEVELGDRVRTVDEETGKDSGQSRKVVATVHRKGVKALTTVTIAVGLAAGALPAGADAGSAAPEGPAAGVVSVESTDGHRFLVTQPAAAAGTGVAGGVGEAGTETDGNGAVNTTLGVSPGGGNGPLWTDAGDLNVGDQVALEGNRVGVVTGTITTRRETDVFNLSVDGDHTFLVTPTPQSADGRINPARGPPAVVTHNTNCGSGSLQPKPGVPGKAYTVLTRVDEKNHPLPGYVGGKVYKNDSNKQKPGGQMLPTHTADGTSISYREWDVDPKPKPNSGRKRNNERLVTGDDNSAYYTGDHYYTFTQLR